MSNTATRLITLIMLLQRRPNQKAAELAGELGVSVRSIHRYMAMLDEMGIPVYTERGPGGGCALVDSYRTNLTGFTDDELQALFTLSIPAPLAELGISHKLKTALLKLSAALPATRRLEEMRVRQRIHLDSAWWFQG